MSSGSRSGLPRDQRTVVLETKHLTHSMNHERRDSILDYDGLAIKWKTIRMLDFVSEFL